MAKQNGWIGLFAMCAISAASSGASVAAAQTVWCGPPITYQQPAAGQADTLTAEVAINRGITQGIFNSAKESSYFASSPAGTEWAFGRASGFARLTFQPWRHAVDEDPPATVGRDMVVHLIAENIYLDVRFTAWVQAPGAGSRFTYERSTPGPCIPTAAPLPAWALLSFACSLLLLGTVLTGSRRRRPPASS